MDTAFMASRRSMLTGTFGAIGATMLATIPAVAAPTITPVMAAIAAEVAATERYNRLPPNLELTNPNLHAVEEQRLSAAWDRMIAAMPEDWSDFVAQVDHMTNDGEFPVREADMPLMMRKIRLLLKADAARLLKGNS